MAHQGKPAYVSDDYDDRADHDDNVERRASSRQGSTLSSASRDPFHSPRGGRSRTSSNAAPVQLSPEVLAQITEQVMQTMRMVSEPQGDYDAPLRPSRSTSSRVSGIPPSPHYKTRRESSNFSTSSRPANSQDYQEDWIGVEPEIKSCSSYDEDMGSSTRHSTESFQRLRTRGTQQDENKFVNDMITLEKVWQPLFDTNGNGTTRLGQFLRGLALHIIDTFEPRHSIVVTPEKMLQFYNDTKVTEELYPWQMIFGGTMDYPKLSRLYRDICCEHFFVQERSNERPTVPALTPSGFATWMTHIIRAHPDTEHERCKIALRIMPISNADDLKERFPKELPRRLFPTHPNLYLREDLEYSIFRKGQMTSPRTAPATAAQSSTSQPPNSSTSPPSDPRSQSFNPLHSTSTTDSSRSPSFPPPQPQTRSRTHHNASSAGRASPSRHAPPANQPQQNPFPAAAAAKSNDPVDDSATSQSSNASPPSPPAISLERERKPYTAHPGGGKVYDSAQPSSANMTPRSTGPASSSRPDLMPQQMGHAPEEAPQLPRQGPTTTGRGERDRRESSAEVDHNNNKSANATSNRDGAIFNAPGTATSSRPPTRTPSVRHSTAQTHTRRRSSLVSAEIGIEPSFTSPRNEGFPPSSYGCPPQTRSRDASIGLNRRTAEGGAYSRNSQASQRAREEARRVWDMEREKEIQRQECRDNEREAEERDAAPSIRDATARERWARRHSRSRSSEGGSGGSWWSRDRG